jgi:hypothetical protein
VRRLLLVPDQNGKWANRQVYNSALEGAPFSLIYLDELGGFVTLSNLARVLDADNPQSSLIGRQLSVQEEDSIKNPLPTFTIQQAKEIPPSHGHLGVYHPLIPLDLSPLRFRVLVPLASASDCVDLAVARWKEQFARVWDRLPPRVGVIAFPRLVPYQAVVEAARGVENALARGWETWRVQEVERRAGVVTLRLRRGNDRETLRVVPVTLPDGREDVFYPYVVVEDPNVRYPRDFQHPYGQVYRHVADLSSGDGIQVFPARVKTLFLESAAARFDTTPPRYLEEWNQMRAVWELLQRVAPSQATLQHLRSELTRLEVGWRSPDGHFAPPENLWRDTLRSLLVHHLEVKGAALEMLTDSATEGILQWALDWHMTALKESL